MAASATYKRKESLQKIFIAFLRKSGCESLTVCTPDDIRRFLVWKDCNGKNIMHDLQCPILDQKGSFHCNCHKCLASNTVEEIINQLVSIFDDIGLGRDWNIVNSPCQRQCELFPSLGIRRPSSVNFSHFNLLL